MFIKCKLIFIKKSFPFEFAWQKYLEIPHENLALWEKMDKFYVFHKRKGFRYEQKGLLFDDLWDGEQPYVNEALNRIPEELKDARKRRIDRAFELSVHKTDLPKEQWTPIEIDYPYLTPYVYWVLAEMEEKDAEYMSNHGTPIFPYLQNNLKEFHSHGDGNATIFSHRMVE
jgi:hypothetical protein